MVIQVVNFNLEGIDHDQYLGAATEVAPAFKELDGLKSKVWLSDKDNNTYGGVYTWDNRESMENYLNSEFYDQVLGSNPNFVNITYKSYYVLDNPTSITS
jgi:heme-degrading monooxygenase HmoA